MTLQERIDLCDVEAVNPERVRAVQAALMDDNTTERLAEVFSAFADPTRLRIVNALAQGELCVCDLSAALGLSQSATSHQLRVLRNLRLAKHRRVGRLVYYSLDDAHVGRLFAQGLEHVKEGR